METQNKNYERFIIAVVGDLCSGRETVAKYLVDNYGFTEVKYQITDDINIPIETYENNNILKVKPNPALKNLVADISIKGLVFYPFITEVNLNYLMTRVAFKLIYIETPVKIRYSNFLQKYPGKTWDDFLEMDSELSNNPFWVKMKSLVHCRISNIGTVEDLYSKVSCCYQQITIHYRPCWDDYFMKVAREISERCNCRKSKVGAVIVKDKRILSVGYNGTPSKLRNCFQGSCERCWNGSRQGENLDKCICIHAEENAVRNKV